VKKAQKRLLKKVILFMNEQSAVIKIKFILKQIIQLLPQDFLPKVVEQYKSMQKSITKNLSDFHRIKTNKMKGLRNSMQDGNTNKNLRRACKYS